MEQLDVLLKGLGFTQKKADSQVRWSVLNTILLLRRHEAARAKLADGMSQGKSVGSINAQLKALAFVNIYTYSSGILLVTLKFS